ncbi:DUF2285 domain-containing protein [Neorhizobium sp. DT-125]|uniref:DUF2285 domain-containing protein n=1 Tax=Neorhizobium sp. DT-125 TaxID=3396163 RepID=UPI003F1CE7CC
MKVTKDDFLDQPPGGASLTAYDEAHAKLYLRLLDAEAQGAAWQDVVEVLFGLSAKDEPERASRVYAAHLARARWMTEHGFGQLVGSRLH